MADLRLKLDPSQLVQGADRAERSLDDVKRAAVGTENAVEAMGRAIPDHYGKATSATEIFARSTRNTSPSLRALQNNSKDAGSAMRFAGGNARLMSMQLSQVAQQGAVTGNYLQALMVQIPDLALGFGAVGIIAGALVPVLYGVAQGFLGAEDSGATLDDRLDIIAASMDDVKAASDILSLSQAELARTFGESAARARSFAEIQLTLAVTAASDALRQHSSIMDDVSQKYIGGARSGRDLANALARIIGDFNVGAGAAREFRDILIDLRAAGSLDEQQAALERIVGFLEQAKVAGADLPPEFAAALGEMLELSNASDEARAQLERIAGLDISSNIGWGADEAARLADNLARAAMIGVTGFGGDMSQIPGEGANAAVAEQRIGELQDAWRASQRPARGGRKSGGGRSSAAKEIDQTKKAYDSLISSLDEATRAQMQFADAQEVITKAQEAGYITTLEAAEAYGLAQKRFDESIAAINDGASVWDKFKDAGGNAIDRLIDGTLSLKDALKDMIKELVLAITKKNLLNSIPGATSGMSVGGMIFQGLFGGFFDNGGTIGMGQSGVVGERGPERVTATAGGAVVTSRADTARMAGGRQEVAVRVEGGNLTMSDNGQIMANVRVIAQSQRQGAVSDVRRSFGNIQQEYNMSGGLVA